MSVNPDRLCSWRPPHESVGDCAEGPGRGLHCTKRIARRSFLAPSRLFSCSTTAPFRLRNSPPAVSAANHTWKHYRLWQFTSTAQNCTRQFLGQSVRSSLSTLSFVNVISAAGRRLAQGAQSFVQLSQVYAYASADGYAERGYWSGSDFQFAASTHRQPSTNQLPNATQTQPANLTSPQLIPCARGCPQVVCLYVCVWCSASTVRRQIACLRTRWHCRSPELVASGSTATFSPRLFLHKAVVRDTHSASHSYIKHPLSPCLVL